MLSQSTSGRPVSPTSTGRQRRCGPRPQPNGSGPELDGDIDTGPLLEARCGRAWGVRKELAGRFYQLLSGMLRLPSATGGPARPVPLCAGGAGVEDRHDSTFLLSAEGVVRKSGGYGRGLRGTVSGAGLGPPHPHPVRRYESDSGGSGVLGGHASGANARADLVGGGA